MVLLGVLIKPDFFLNFLLDGKAWRLEPEVPKIAIRGKKLTIFFCGKKCGYLSEMFRRSRM